MNKEKLKELLSNPELEYFIDEFDTGSVGLLSDFIEQKRKELEEPVYKTEDGYEFKKGEVVYAWLIGTIEICSVEYDDKAFTKNDKFFKLKENAENCFNLWRFK